MNEIKVVEVDLSVWQLTGLFIKVMVAWCLAAAALCALVWLCAAAVLVGFVALTTVFGIVVQLSS